MFTIGIGIILALIALGFLIVAAYCDVLKRSEIPDSISIPFIVSVVLVRAGWAAWTRNWWFLLEGLSAGLILFAFGYLLYRLRQWGGADLLLVAGVGVTVGWTLPPDLASLFSPLLPSSFLPAWATFLLNMMVIGSVYGIGWMVVLAFRSEKLREAFLKSLREGWMGILVCAALLSALAYVVGMPVLQSAGVGALLWIFYLFAQKVETNFFVRSIPVRQLRLEDWLVEDIKVKGKIIASASNPGITEKEFELVRKAIASKKLKGEVKVKEGIPFVPVFPITLIIMIAWGDILFGFMSVVARVNYGITTTI